jgi:hypothetical protein
MTELHFIPAKTAAMRLGVPRTRIRQLDNENKLVVVSRNGQSCVPEDFLLDRGGEIELVPMSGTITLLRDAGFEPEEIITWLFEIDEALGDTPIALLRQGKIKDVNRVAQTLGF